MNKNKILILGISGMLGHRLFKIFRNYNSFEVFGTARSLKGLADYFTKEEIVNVKTSVDADNFDSIIRVFSDIKPDIVINCIGIIKQLPAAKDPIISININSLLPHRLAMLCGASGARLIHISTDCVFSGKKGNYLESDFSDAEDLYGKSKFLGEVNYSHCITLRTSIIGHELQSKFGLIEWFLSQNDNIKGFTKAIYTGFPTTEIARILSDYVFPRQDLCGLYQVSSEPISKYDLLRIVAKKYGKKIEIEPYDDFVLDRSLNSDLFRKTTGYIPPSWPEMIENMHKVFLSNKGVS